MLFMTSIVAYMESIVIIASVYPEQRSIRIRSGLVIFRHRCGHWEISISTTLVDMKFQPRDVKETTEDEHGRSDKTMNVQICHILKIVGPKELVTSALK